VLRLLIVVVQVVVKQVVAAVAAVVYAKLADALGRVLSLLGVEYIYQGI